MKPDKKSKAKIIAIAETVTCECGKKERLENARYTEDGQWICASCMLDEPNIKISPKLKLTK